MISINDLTKENIYEIISNANKIKETKIYPNLSKNNIKVIGIFFVEPSTRTMHSFESAIYRSNAKIIKYNKDTSSEKKGETLYDSVRTMSSYVDMLIVRHPQLSKTNELMFSKKNTNNLPIINAGNNHFEHPTQALLDIFTIFENITFHDYKVINLGLAGDLKYSRTIHSLIYIFNILELKVRYYFICNDQFLIEDKHLCFLKEKNIEYSYHNNLIDVLPDLDILYMTRIQVERHNENIENNSELIYLDKLMLKKAKNDLIILHPLPRNNEINTNVDDDHRAKYFDQVENGVYVRAAIIDFILNNTK